MILKLPPRLAKKLMSDELEYGRVRMFVDKFEVILRDNKLEFFPEYTDHGIDHITDVLNAAEELISEPSWELLTANDVSLLVQAVVLHDLGMHLNSHLFHNLITNDEITIKEIDKKTWPALWMEFIEEAMRLSDIEQLNILGSIATIQIPDFANLTDRDKRLIGEFLRRHHPRLCHEISIGALHSFHAENDLNGIFGKNIRFLAGIIGRSHGMALRDTFPYLKNVYSDGWKTPFGVKAIFLMVLVRIADYMQIQKERAPAVLYRIRNLKSPYSQREWELHNSIDYFVRTADDPEKIFVQCSPKNTESFLRIKTLLEDIQFELDKSWAVLGEAYGTTRFQSLGLNLRRIVTNVNEEDKTFKFVPRKINYSTDPSILKLLVRPLYNNNPAVGIRELLQNAIDACREHTAKDFSTKAEVVVRIVRTSIGYQLIVEDNGIGMTEQTLIQYYFRAGMSFRESRDWVNAFTDRNRSSLIIRSGKFGIGSLAAFLLGDEIHVETRYHLNEREAGLSFSTTFSDESIEVKRVPINREGTRIVITLHKALVTQIELALQQNRKLDWFMLYLADDPSVNYKIDDEIRQAFSFPHSPHIEPNFPTSSRLWRCFIADSLEYHWTFDDENSEAGPDKGLNLQTKLTCNGFLIRNGYTIQDESYPWIAPRIAIIDRNGKVDISLDRNSIYNDQLPHEKQLLNDMCKELTAGILSLEFEEKKGMKIVSSTPNFKSATPLRHHIYCGKQGYILNSPSIFKLLGIRKNYHFWVFSDDFLPEEILTDKTYYRLIKTIPRNADNLSDEYDEDDLFLLNWFAPRNDFRSVKNLGSRKIYLDASYNQQKRIEEKVRFKSDPRLAKLLKQVGQSIKPVKDVSAFDSDFIHVEKLKKIQQHFFAIQEAKFALDEAEIKRKDFTLFVSTITHLLGDHLIIPYSFEDRVKLFHLDSTELGDRVLKQRKTLI
jgi:molecular chaperone HtpG